MKVCVICFDFKKENIRRQPWRYIYEVSEGLAERGLELVVITDTPSTAMNGIKICTVKRLHSILGESKEVLDVLKEENPDIVLMLLGMTSFLRLSFKINKPVIGILTSPVYSPREVLQVGSKELIRHFNYLFIHLIGSLVPRFLVRRWSNEFKHIVVLSKKNKRRLESLGVNTEILVIPPGIDTIELELLDKDRVKKIRTGINPENIPSILYFTSPLTLRGTDTLVKGFARIRKIKPCKLIILSRLEHEELVQEERLLNELARREGVTSSIVFLSRYLSPEEVKVHLSLADIICLPFKIVISDVPMSILEAMALGKPVISTNIGCIAEILDGRGVVVEPDNPEKLADAIVTLLNDKEMAHKLGEAGKRYMETYPRGSDISGEYLRIMQKLTSN